MRGKKGRILFAVVCAALLLGLSGGQAQAGHGLLQWLHDLIHGCEDVDSGAPCALFLVQDTGLNLSEIQRVGLRDPATGDPIFESGNLSTCPGCDVEASSVDPMSGTLYAVAGGDASSAAPLPVAGDLLQIDPMSGAFTVVGSTGAVGANEIVGASFRPTDGTLWVFQENVGLLTVETSDASTTPRFSIAGVTDQDGDPVGSNWEGLAWDADGAFLFGSQDQVLYRWNPDTSAVHRVCSNLAPAGLQVEALESSTDGSLIGSQNQTANRTLIDIVVPENEADYGDDACAITEIALPSGPLTDDIESLAFRACPTGCAVGEPKALVFEYTGESCAATTNNQNGHLLCWGNPSGAQPVRVKLWSLDSRVVPHTEMINVGDTFRVEAFHHDLGLRTTFSIKKGWRKKQKLSIVTSCSKPLAVGDQFGSVILREFIPED